MAEHQAHIRWRLEAGAGFTDLRYSRAHSWEFDGGVIVPASSAVSSVPLPYSRAENVDPEEAFVAAISSCHMLTFLYLAAKDGFIVESYDDLAVGITAPNEKGRLAVASVRLAPRIEFSGVKSPTATSIEQLHHAAHEECYIANSVKTVISVSGSWEFHRVTTAG